MGFSVTSDVDLRRRAIIFLQDLARAISSAANLITPLINTLDDEGKLLETYSKIKDFDRNVKDLKRNLINTLIKAGPILTGRDELIRLVSSLSSIMDYIEATAYRLTHYKRVKNLPDTLIDQLKTLSKNVSEIISTLRECVFLMGSNPNRISDVGERIIKKESKIDEISRGLELSVLNGDYGTTASISVLEIVKRLENASDEALNALDLLTILVML